MKIEHKYGTTYFRDSDVKVAWIGMDGKKRIDNFFSMDSMGYEVDDATFTAAVALIEGRTEPVRCDVTGHPYGTDTRPVGSPCLCRSCASVALASKDAKIARLEKALAKLEALVKLEVHRGTAVTAIEVLEILDGTRVE